MAKNIRNFRFSRPTSKIFPCNFQNSTLTLFGNFFSFNILIFIQFFVDNEIQSPTLFPSNFDCFCTHLQIIHSSTWYKKRGQDRCQLHTSQSKQKTWTSLWQSFRFHSISVGNVKFESSFHFKIIFSQFSNLVRPRVSFPWWVFNALPHYQIRGRPQVT